MNHLREAVTSYCFHVISMVYCLDEWINTRVICNRLQEIKKIDIQEHKKKAKEQKQNKTLNQLYKKETINKVFKVILTKRSEICLYLRKNSSLSLFKDWCSLYSKVLLQKRSKTQCLTVLVCRNKETPQVIIIVSSMLNNSAFLNL